MLLADLLDVIQAALPLILAVGWGLLQLFSSIQENNNKQKRVEQRKQAKVPGAAEAGDEQGGMRSEVDEFLRKLQEPDEPADRRDEAPAQREPKQREPKSKKPRRPRIEVLVDDDPSAEPTRREPVRSESTDAEPPPRRVASREEKPKKVTPQPRLATNKLAEQAAHLGDRIAQADDNAEARIHEKFDHDVGSLNDATDVYEQSDPANEKSASAKPDTAQSIAAMLREPDNIRNAVILNEILRRPNI